VENFYVGGIPDLYHSSSMLSRFTLLVLCLGLFSSFALVPEHATPHTFALRVMSYNIHHCNPPSEPGKIDVEAVVQTIREADPDLVALQEVDVNTGRSGNIDQAKTIAEALEMEYYFGKAIDFDGGAYGVAILSKYPIRDEMTYALPTQDGSGGEPRVLAAVRVKLPKRRNIIFASTHLSAQAADDNRLLQIRRMAEIALLEDLPMVIAGDFNAEPGSEVINIMDSFLQRSCEDCEPTIPVNNPERAIDFIAFRPGLEFEVVSHQVIQETYASDHLPVLSVLQFER
jgi:endonuclease/exonuclease/phosphatase family metal-dependent hydrolase